MKKVVVNGIDGNFGQAVVEGVLKLLPHEILVFTAPSETALEPFKKQGIQTEVLAYDNVQRCTEVFENADKVLVVSMPFVGEKRRKAHAIAIEACQQADVKQVIYTSVISASNPLNPSIENIDHAYTESLINNSGLDYIILRNALFAEAFTSEYVLAQANKQTTITKNTGEGRVAYISRRDAAFAASCALANPLIHRSILNINGYEAVSYETLLEIGNRVTGSKIEYIRQTDEELYAYFDSIGVPRDTDGDFSKSPIQATSEGMVSFGTAVREGHLDIEANDFVALTGRQAVSLEFMFANIDDYLLGERHVKDTE